ncbi:hypothetical protein HRbin36_02059 [bacterium HR36]|nr:hypothetical protein HRbin36_02059 [bacterium HR36]
MCQSEPLSQPASHLTLVDEKKARHRLYHSFSEGWEHGTENEGSD